MVGVKYSTKRPKADQSPYESIDAGLASCTGLSVLLIDACRSVGVPARFVGTPLWSDGSGNHSWVEVWDEGWHFTGAAEPTGNDLDKAWFSGRASGANRDDPRNAIYATTWRKTPITFPLVWLPTDTTVSAVDVTDRYTTKEAPTPEGMARVRFRVVGADGTRRSENVKVLLGDEVLFEGMSKDERFDANDHLAAALPLGSELRTQVAGVEHPFTVEEDEQLITVTLQDSRRSSANALRALRRWISQGSTGEIGEQPFADVPLRKQDAVKAQRALWAAHKKRIQKDRSAEMEAKVLEIDGVKMPFWYTTYGKKPKGGRSLWISMHGGGGAPEHVNTQQWENQKRLYTPAEGVYLAPRAPTDTWNLWHQGHIDGLFDRLIENMIVFEDVDPEKIYIMGYSAGGDGVYQLAPRMADRWAAAAMMAGHPNDARPESLRNTAFTLHVGENDTPYKRNTVAKTWGDQLAALKKADPEGYDHWVEIHKGKSHWMDRQDAAALPWMAQRTRDSRPEKIIWVQDDVAHPRFYWLAAEKPRGRSTTTAHRIGQEIHLEGEGPLTVRLDDEMLALDSEVVAIRNGEEVHRGVVPRTIRTLARTLAERGDPRGIYSAQIVVE
jgi:poly(3-hydroxybutyrate) depolymerase